MNGGYISACDVNSCDERNVWFSMGLLYAWVEDETEFNIPGNRTEI